MDCGGILKSATISFGQQLVPEVIDRAMQAAGEADLLLAIGSTLQVYPVAAAVPRAKAAGARVVIVNAEPTQFDDIADAVIRQRIGEVLPAIDSESPSQLIDHGIPNRSTTMPKRAAQNVCSSGNITLPSLASSLKDALGLARALDLNREREALGWLVAIGRDVGTHQDLFADRHAAVHHLVLPAGRDLIRHR